MEQLGISIGTSYTSIFLKGNGIVLHEPTMIAYHGDPKNGKIRAVGEQARDMLGKTPDGTVIVSPIKEGFIVDPISMYKLLNEYIRKIIPQKLIMPRIRAIVGIPTGLSIQERKIYEDIFIRIGIKDIVMLENILLTGVGLGLPIARHKGKFIVNIGGGITDIAAISLGGILAGCSVNVGGGMMDRALIDCLLGKYNVRFGLNTIRRLKGDIGSLHRNDISSVVLTGSDINTCRPVQVEVFALDICEALQSYYMRIAEAIESIFNVLPPEIVSDIYNEGIYVSGGASKIAGLDKLLNDKLSIKVHVSNTAEFSVVLGAGHLLVDEETLSSIKSNE